MRTWILIVLAAGCRNDVALNGGSYGGTVSDDRGAATPPDGPLDLPETCEPGDPIALWMSPDDSNSMSSPVQARQALLARKGPAVFPIRPWEFLNYYRFDYPAADPGQLRVALDLIPGAEDGEYTLQIGIASAPATTDPMNLALVIDDSCSMSGKPLEVAADVGRAIASQLRAGDRLSVVTWSEQQHVLLEARSVTGPNDRAVLDALDGLRPEGGTDLSGGLLEGYDLLEQHFADDQINRLILISDGGANIGETDETVIGAHAGAEDEAGVYLVGVGVGVNGYNDLLMDTVTDLGKGASVFVPDRGEADRMFRDRFASTVGVGARDVHVRLDLPPGFSLVRTSAEEVSTDPAQVRPQHVSPGDAMVLHQTVASACEDVPADTAFGVTVTWLDPVTFEAHETSVSATLGELEGQDHRLLLKGAAVMAYVDALRAVRDQETDPAEAASAARSAVDEARALAPNDPDLVEIDGILDAL